MPVVGLQNLVRHQANVALYHFFIEAASDQALHGIQGIVRIGHCLALGRLAHKHLVAIGEADNGRGGAITLAVLDHPCLTPFHHRDAGVGGTQVNSDNLAHFL
jgi:hypothetical protein